MTLSLIFGGARLSPALGLGFILLAASCQSNAECDDLPRYAWNEVEKINGQHVQCSVDEDCRAVEIPSGCWQLPTCTFFFVGNASLEQAVLDATNRVNDLCERFEAQSCTYPVPGCPFNPLPEVLRCEQARCVVDTPQSRR